VNLVCKPCVAALAIFCHAAFCAPEPAGEFERAIELIKARNWKEAELLLDKSLAGLEPPPRVLYWKAYVQFATGRYSESVSVLREFIGRNPDDGQARKLLGLDLFMTGDEAAAQTELERAVGLLPSDEDARYYLGRVYFSRQNMPAALATFKQLLAIHPASVRGYNHLGQAYEGLNDFENAQQAYEQAIAIDRTAAKRSEWPHYNLAVLQLKAGKAEAALPHFAEALLIQPKFAEARLQHAVALAAVGKRQQARSELQALITDQPDNADAHYQMGRLYAKMGDQPKAREHLLLFERLRKK
jgi:tetratricopeptide (TPR) repeat protein